MDSIATYVEQLKDVNGDGLDAEAFRLVGVEKLHMARLIAHLAEISKRRLHLEWGFPNLFAYCSKRLGLSEGSIALRTQVAGVCQRFPALLELLSQNRISLSVAGLVAPHLTAENLQRLLADCEGKTRAWTKEYLVALKPKNELSSGIRQAPNARAVALREVEPDPADGRDAKLPELPEHSSVATPSTPQNCAVHLDDLRLSGGPGDANASAPSNSSSNTNGAVDRESQSQRSPAKSIESAMPVGSGRMRAGTIEPARPDVFNFRFAGGGVFKAKVERLAEVLGVHHVAGNLANVLEVAVDIALDKKDPLKKLERRRKRQARKSNACGREPAANGSTGSTPSGSDELGGGRIGDDRSTRNEVGDLRMVEYAVGSTHSEGPRNLGADGCGPLADCDRHGNDRNIGDEVGGPRIVEKGGAWDQNGAWVDRAKFVNCNLTGIDPIDSDGPLEDLACDKQLTLNQECENEPRSNKVTDPKELVTAPCTQDPALLAPRSRYISSKVREQVFELAGQRCEFVGPMGRCEKRTGLEVDHIRPFGKLGGHEAGNLRCLCRSHNLLWAEQQYGRDFVRAKVASRS